MSLIGKWAPYARSCRATRVDAAAWTRDRRVSVPAWTRVAAFAAEAQSGLSEVAAAQKKAGRSLDRPARSRSVRRRRSVVRVDVHVLRLADEQRADHERHRGDDDRVPQAVVHVASRG